MKYIQKKIKIKLKYFLEFFFSIFLFKPRAQQSIAGRGDRWCPAPPSAGTGRGVRRGARAPGATHAGAAGGRQQAGARATGARGGRAQRREARRLPRLRRLHPGLGRGRLQLLGVLREQKYQKKINIFLC